MWKGFSFKEDPKAFFTFTKDILDTSVQELVLWFMEQSGQLDHDVVNCLDDEGYTPFLRYVQTYIKNIWKMQ